MFHTASPFQQQVEDPQRDLVDPAVKVRCATGLRRPPAEPRMRTPDTCQQCIGGLMMLSW